MSTPVVSVLMAVYNTAQYLTEAIESILGQSFGDFELIAVEDCSTDGGREMLYEWAARDERLKVVQNERNLGLTRSLNRGLDICAGEFVARMDSDDTAYPHRFERQLAYLRQHPDCVAVGAQMDIIDPEGGPLGKTSQPLAHEGIELDLLKGHGAAILHPMVVMRRDALRRLGGYRVETGVNDDLDLFIRLGEIGRLANLPDVLGSFRRHPESMTSINMPPEAKQVLVRVLEDARQRRGLAAEEMPPLELLPHPTSKAEWHAKWAFRAQSNGYPASAKKHARRALCCNPFSPWAIRALLHIGMGEHVGGLTRRMAATLRGGRDRGA